VVTFLAWAACPEQDERKLVGIKALTILGLMMVYSIYQKRLKWAPLKSRRVGGRCGLACCGVQACEAGGGGGGGGGARGGGCAWAGAPK
jgi:hypothetical protein